MPNLNITKPELIWPGKYDEAGKRIVNRGAALPFQIIETIRDGRATRDAGGPDLFAFASQKNETDNSDKWHNKLIWGDNLLVMSSLLQQYAGKIDLIYIDPPFATGADFSFTTEIGDSDWEVFKEQSSIEEKAYRDTWGNGAISYYAMLYSRLTLIRELLSSKGTLYLHLDRNVSQAVKMICDEVFGDESFINDLTWKRSHAHGDTGQGAKHFGRVSESILVYAKDNTGNQIWNPQYIPYTEQILARDYKYVDEQGNRYRFMPCDGPGGASKGNPHYEFKGIKGYWRYSKQKMQELYDAGEIVISSTGKSLSRKRFLKDAKGTPIVDLWDDLNRISPTSSERLNYPTQKPEALLERIIKASSNEGDIVADFFCGSGTTLAVAEKLGRRWVGTDLGRFAIHTTRKRLLGVPECKPFQILNLGQYERKYWQGEMFGKTDASPEAALVADYVRFILELYQAQPCSGFRHIHGRKGRVLVAVGAVDAPVTITQVNEAVTECAAAGQKELHILGWEWEMGMNDPIIKQAKASHDVILRLMTIPREVMEKRAVECGDIRFFDVAYLKAEVAPQDKARRKVKLELKNFAIPDIELIPEEVRQKITKWSDYIDYWAVDWDYRRDTFMNQWQTYRTRTDRKLALASAEHEYKAAGKYEILVKVVDIFGNDTSLLLEWKTK